MNATGSHIAWFTIETPEGMIYTYGSEDLYGVDISENTNYYLPNFYTYPETSTFRNRFGKAEIEVAQLPYQPFFGPKKFITFGNTYERNYKITQSPTYTSAWHLISVESKLTLDKIDLKYEAKTISYYADKSYSHTFPNFGIANGSALSTFGNTELNDVHPSTTKWENGRAEFAYSVTQSSLTRWDLTTMDNNRGEMLSLTYGVDRGEIYGDELCKRIEVFRNNNLYKEHKL